MGEGASRLRRRRPFFWPSTPEARGRPSGATEADPSAYSPLPTGLPVSPPPGGTPVHTWRPTRATDQTSGPGPSECDSYCECGRGRTVGAGNDVVSKNGRRVRVALFHVEHSRFRGVFESLQRTAVDVSQDGRCCWLSMYGKMAVKAGLGADLALFPVSAGGTSLGPTLLRERTRPAAAAACRSAASHSRGCPAS